MVTVKKKVWRVGKSNIFESPILFQQNMEDVRIRGQILSNDRINMYRVNLNHTSHDKLLKNLMQIFPLIKIIFGGSYSYCKKCHYINRLLKQIPRCRNCEEDVISLCLESDVDDAEFHLMSDDA